MNPSNARGISRPNPLASNGSAGGAADRPTQPLQRSNPTPSRSFVGDLGAPTNRASAGVGQSRANPAHPRLTLDASSRKTLGGLISLDSDDALSMRAVWDAPLGKPQLRFERIDCPPDAHRTSSAHSKPSEGPSVPEALPPLPSRPGHIASSKSRQSASLATGHVPRGVITTTKPYALLPPPSAPHIARDRHADFFPWIGTHPEDALSEQVIQQGFYDKVSPSQNEHQSARPSIWPTLKHKSGFQSLSSLFVSVLEQKRSNGRITAASTFKPPPRVTLTDTKREAWLRDLANSKVPLRRLSRTIPHGIRGKVLLEQCMGKNIPPRRAVWLAKCVGANEMRAFKRKGPNGTFAMGGEGKWIRDWTIFVEQFVEGVMRTCGERDWKSKMAYAIRLSAHLYSEHLLDKDHYLSWLVAAIEGAETETMPTWLVLLQIYWDDLVGSRQFGRRLAEALLDKIHEALKPGRKDILNPLITRLARLAADILRHHPHNLTSPRTWTRHQDIFRFHLADGDPPLSPLVDALDARVERLTSPIQQRSRQGSASAHLYRLLDAWKYPMDLEQLCSECLTASEDRDLVVLGVVGWACSWYRQGLSRVYLAARLIRRWNRHGADTDGVVLRFLATMGNRRWRRENVYLLISELVRSKRFSVGRYLEWLISRGTLYNSHGLREDASSDVRLLIELPLNGLPAHLINLRHMLLNNVGFRTDDETQSLAQAKARLSAMAPNLLVDDSDLDTDVHIHQSSARASLSNLSRTVKSEIGQWIRQCVGVHVTKIDPIGTGDWSDSTGGAGMSAITIAEFNVVRRSLEDMDDFSILADVLRIVSNSGQPLILASVADTVSYHHDTFAAIGALRHCFEQLLESFRQTKKRKTIETPLLRSFLELASRMHAADDATQDAVAQMEHTDPRSAVAAFSPVSDHVSDMLQSTDSDLAEEVERILSSGTNMDTHTFARLFTMLVGRVETTRDQGKWQTQTCFLLARLRMFDTNAFDDMIATWVVRVLRMAPRPPLAQLWSPFVIAGCLTIDRILTCVMESTARLLATGDESVAGEIAFETLAFFSRDVRYAADSEHGDYRLRLQQAQFAEDHSVRILLLIRRAIECAPSDQDGTAPSKVSEIIVFNDYLISVLRSSVVIDSCEIYDHLISPLLKGPKHTAPIVRRVLRFILGEVDDQGQTPLDPKKQLDTIVRDTDHLSLPFCQLKLRCLLLLDSDLKAPEGDAKDSSLVVALFEAIRDYATAIGSAHIDLVTVLDSKLADVMHDYAEALVLESVEAPSGNVGGPKFATRHVTLDRQATETLLSIIQATASSTPGTTTSKAWSDVVERLEGFARSTGLPDLGLASNAVEEQDAMASRDKEIGRDLHLSVLIRLILIHPSMVQREKAEPSEHARMVTLLTSIMVDMQQHGHDGFAEYMFDVVAWLMDGMCDEGYLQCAKAFKERAQHPKLRYLFGYREGPGGGLKVSQRGKVVPFSPRPWELLADPTPNMGENDTSLSLTLFQAQRL
ncbi:MAG: RNA polymerase II mediator complex subunit [Piccolia ochrophora]|nr:MAG: RNA polymerase II mediator complex subunit [Piccolia ochrophora]